MDYSKYKGRPSLRLAGADYGERRTYFVTFNTKNKEPFFGNPTLAASLLSIIIHARLANGFCVYGFCIMPEHVHLMVQPVYEITLSNIVRSIKGRMTPVFRKHHPGETLWQRGYVDKIIKDEKDFHNVLAYIVLNPVKADLAKDEFEYPFCGVLDYYL
jgi:putative transposase